MKKTIAEYKFAGLQRAGHCLCGDLYGKYGQVGEDECNLACTGQPSQTCGSHWRNSVFSAGYESMYYGSWA